MLIATYKYMIMTKYAFKLGWINEAHPDQKQQKNGIKHFKYLLVSIYMFV